MGSIFLKKINKTLMTNCSSFELESKQHACYYAMATWL